MYRTTHFVLYLHVKSDFSELKCSIFQYRWALTKSKQSEYEANLNTYKSVNQIHSFVCGETTS